jgi:hypothetical protein
MKIKFRFEKGILEVAIPGVGATREPGRVQLEGGKRAAAVAGKAE